MPKDITKNDKNNKKEKKHVFKDFKAELKKVIWPTPKQLINNTVAVITIVLITATIVFILDLIFKIMNDYGIDNLKGFIEKNSEQSEDTNTSEQIENTVNDILNSESTNTTENSTDSTENKETENNTEN